MALDYTQHPAQVGVMETSDTGNVSPRARRHVIVSEHLPVLLEKVRKKGKLSAGAET